MFSNFIRKEVKIIMKEKIKLEELQKIGFLAGVEIYYIFFDNNKIDVIIEEI